MGGCRKTQVAQGVIRGLPLRGRNGEEGGQRSPASGQVFSYRPDGNRVSASSVRPSVIADGLPEQVGATALLPLPGSLAAAVGEQPELLARSSHNVEEREAGWTAPLINRMGEGIRDAALFL